MARTTKTTSTGAKSTKVKTTAKAKSNGCILTIKPKVLIENLNLLNAALGSNKQGLDRLKIEVGEAKSLFSIGGDIGVKIRHKANKTLSSAPIQVSCRQLKNLASNLDGTNQKLTLEEEGERKKVWGEERQVSVNSTITKLFPTLLLFINSAGFFN